MKHIILVLSLCALSAFAQVPTTQRSKPARVDAAIDQRAVAALQKMSGFLGTLKTFGVTSESSRDEIVDTDMKIQKNATGKITVRLPDRLHAAVDGDDKDFEFYYDGQTVTLFSPKQNYYASSPAPPTVARTLDAIRAQRGIVLPLTDFIQMATGENLLQDITRAGYIGTSRIDGKDCDHVAVRQEDVDWQVWIEQSETPVPRKIVITTKKQPTQPQYVAMLTWDLSPTIDDSLFTFKPPANAVRIKFGKADNSGGEK